MGSPSKKTPLETPKLTPVRMAEADKISIKIPPFWEKSPEIWFLQVEAQFTLNKITTEDTKFNHLVAQLEPRYIENIWDIVTGSSKEKYKEAKTRLLDVFKISEEAKLKSLLTDVDLGDRQPSQLLRKMKALAGSDISDKALRTLWLEKMPEAIRGILVISEEGLERQAVMADKILQMTPRNEVYAAASSSKQVPAAAAKDTLDDRLARIEKRLARIPLGQQRSWSRPQHQEKSRQDSRSQGQRRLCRYHEKFGAKSFRCQKPCEWKKSPTEQGNAKKQQD